MYAPPRTITYDTADPIQCTVDIYAPLAPGPGPRDAVVFIHGGAWRSGDKSDHADLPALIADAFAQHNDIRNLPTVIIPNYRLSSNPAHPDRIAVTHPTHIHDVARSLIAVMTDEWLETTEEVVMVGHSCGAHILSHLAFNLPTSDDDPSSTALRTSLARLMRKTRSLAFLDGIYSLRALASEYPSYRFFIDAAFGSDPLSKWPKADVFNPDDPTPPPPPPPPELEGVGKMIISHATADELLTPTQGALFRSYLQRIGLGDVVEWDEGTLKGTHDGCLHERGVGELLYRLLV